MTRYLNSGWLPALAYIVLLVAFTIAAVSRFELLANVLFCAGGLAFVGIIAASLWHLICKRWQLGGISLISVVGCGVATVFAFGVLMFSSMFGPSEDGFADNLTIPEGIEIAEPDAGDTWGGYALRDDTLEGSDKFQDRVRMAMRASGNDSTEFTADMPSLRKASTDHANIFGNYIEASPDWHVFLEQGNRFASRRWSFWGEPRDTLHGYISEFGGDSRFQTRCLLCLDRKQWSRYSVQHVQEGKDSVEPQMTLGNSLHESRVMIECGGVWVEVFEQSDKPERRMTKATVAFLEDEFSDFLTSPKDALAAAQARSRDLASRLAGKDGRPFRLLTGMQPGIYEVAYSLNPGEPGSVYLKAFEVTEGTPLSVERLERASKTRMSWSPETAESFGAKAGFTIYEGDWGKPYAARFEVWFRPDSNKPERKLAERIFKIEGWQR
ncbi:hypothetical protein [Rubripirellula tenax]|uniref:hypothetical protein n=1 Tax=Rubripirellula tenax TaxID=2528015 RepID=UPI0011B56048|nr:hypothetical protein [Rubripirellula tenax]